MSEPTDPKAVQEQIMRIIRLKEAAERDRESARKYREETKKLKAKIAATPINEDGRKAYKELKALIDCAEACQVQKRAQSSIDHANRNRPRWMRWLRLKLTCRKPV
jgi:succinate dehydrogenase/fumarate reductase flavoprotein subunit